MRRLLISPILLACMSPAAATEWIACADPTGTVSADILVGSIDVLSIAQARMSASGMSWATDAQGQEKIVVGQAFEGPETLIVDFTDEGMAGVVASLRLFKASEEEDSVIGGTLRVAGVGAWAVACTGP